jgi:hypothetical protein
LLDANKKLCIDNAPHNKFKRALELKMRMIFVTTAVLALSSVVAQAAEQAPVASEASTSGTAVKSGQFLRSAEGKRVGQIGSIRTLSNGQFAQIIFNSRVIYVPVSTMTTKDKLLTTSLTYDQIKGL